MRFECIGSYKDELIERKILRAIKCGDTVAACAYVEASPMEEVFPYLASFLKHSRLGCCQR